MEIKGRVIAKPGSESGTSTKGPWKKAYLVVRYEEGQYPKDILLSNMRKSDEFERIPIGQTGTFKFDARAKQSLGGKWFCDLECWAWTLNQSASASPPPPPEDAPF